MTSKNSQTFLSNNFQKVFPILLFGVLTYFSFSTQSTYSKLSLIFTSFGVVFTSAILIHLYLLFKLPYKIQVDDENNTLICNSISKKVIFKKDSINYLINVRNKFIQVISIEGSDVNGSNKKVDFVFFLDNSNFKKITILLNND